MGKSIEYLLLATECGIQELLCEYITEEDSENDIFVTISARIDNELIHAEGCETEEALITFAKKLPSGYKIQSCISCRHGNFSPFGDNDNEIFCLSDIMPKNKNDVVSVLINERERIRRKKTLFHCCSEFSPQNNEYYTYNSFSHF